MQYTSYESFETEARQRGFDQVLVRQWEPAKVLDTHTHPFSVWAQVVQGELWLTAHGQTQHLPTGAQFTLDAQVPHAERYGAEGATYWVGRKDA